MATPAELALEQHRVCKALDQARVYVAGADQSDAARALGTMHHSPLRTALEHALASAERVLAYLRAADPGGGQTPGMWRDGE
jgi:hypothetical protein